MTTNKHVTTDKELDECFETTRASRNSLYTDVLKYLSTRLGIPFLSYTDNYGNYYGITTSLRTSDDKTYRTILMDMGPIEQNNIGVFRHIIKEARVHLRIHFEENNTMRPITITPSFRYEHHDGGSNGHDVSFQLAWYPGENRVIEK